MTLCLSLVLILFFAQHNIFVRRATTQLPELENFFAASRKEHPTLEQKTPRVVLVGLQVDRWVKNDRSDKVTARDCN